MNMVSVRHVSKEMYVQMVVKRGAELMHVLVQYSANVLHSQIHSQF